MKICVLILTLCLALSDWMWFNTIQELRDTRVTVANTKKQFSNLTSAADQQYTQYMQCQNLLSDCQRSQRPQ